MIAIVTFFLGYTIGSFIQHWVEWTDWEIALKKYREGIKNI